MILTGGIVYRNNPIYLEASKDFNRAFRKFPCVIVFCFSEDDVINALKYAVCNDIPFRIRSGRQDFQGDSNVDKGMVIDISNINYTLINVDDNLAKFGGGITNRKMYSDLVKRGYTIPSGLCLDTGFGALSSNGGVGFASRYLGLSCDHLFEIEMINYKGEKIIANECSNKDLFWAVRGGLASNFGIIISMSYTIAPVSYVSFYTITWDSKYFVDVVDTWQNLGPNTDVRLSSGMFCEKEPSGNVILSSSGQFFGEPKELESILYPLITAAPTESIAIDFLPYEEAIAKEANFCSGPKNFKGASSFIYKPLDRVMLDELEQNLRNAPLKSRQFYVFVALNGNISNVKPNETAFVHRNSSYLIELESIWDSELDRQDNIDWTNNVKASLATSGVGSYVGFKDLDIVDWQRQYYGDNYHRLREVKTKYDPLNIFNFQQSIEPF